jgi:hypothetical protein
MAKQKFRPTRLGVFSGAKAYIQYVEVLKKRRNAVDTLFHSKSFFEKKAFYQAAILKNRVLSK